jgi:hypothetical protein
MRRLVVATALLAACGSDPVAIDDYASEARDAHCRYLVKCGAIESVEICRRLDVGIHIRLSVNERAAVDAGRIKFDGDDARRCFDALADRSCDVTSKSNRAVPDECLGILTGTLREGEACTAGDQCVSRNCEVPTCNMACCTGMCVGSDAPPRAKAGESCELATCDDESFCDQDVMTCVARRPREAFCVSGAECNFGLDCVQGGSCTTLPVLGQPCTGPCRDEGTTCGSSGLCVKVALAGEACVTSADCSRMYRCDPAKHCTAGIATGAACSPSQRCADDGAFCDVAEGESVGTCALPVPDGAACRRDANCISGICDGTNLRCIPEPVCI